MRIALILAFASGLFAQSLNLSMSTSPSGPVVTVGFTDATPTANVAGVQFTLTLPAGVTAAAPVAGTASASKVLTCAALTCADVGSDATPGTTLNATPFATGPLMSFQLSGSPTASPGTIALSNVLGATSVNASTVNLTSNSLSMSKYDLNSDGLINSADVQIAIQAFQSGTCTGLVSTVGDGKCDITAIVAEILASLGVIQ